MKQKIISALRTKYQRFGLSNEAIDRIASAKEKTVTSEDQIETAIADAETMGLIATELQKSADVERRKASDLQKSFDEYKEAHPDKANITPAPKKEDDEPEWAKKLREANERIEARFKADDAKRKLTLAKESVEAKLKAAGCTNLGILNLTMKGFALGENESEDDAVARLQDEYNASCRETFGDGAAPGLSTPAFDSPKQAVDAKNDFLREQGLLPGEKK